jgi:hypothetical protein
MPRSLAVLCVHGVGNHHVDLAWQQAWEQAVRDGIGAWDPGARVRVEFVLHDDLFEQYPIDAAGVAEALARLLASGVWHGIGDLVRRRALAVPELVRWTAGMVVQWAENEALRRDTRARLAAALRRHRPDVVCAHSLGSLIAYDCFVRAPGRDLIADTTFVSLGSQIGSPFVRAHFGGRLQALAARRWFHLYNREDDVFTAPVSVAAPSYEQVDTFFDVAGVADHDAVAYLRHRNTVARVWAEVAGGRRYRRLGRARASTVRALSPRVPRRALLVGINAYPDPKDRLEGCVNDVFELSALLQECGFKPEDIRVVLDERATAAALRQRVAWLLDDVREGDQRVLYYSGHGAQLPQYSPLETVDHVDECLVPWDFDWTRERAIVDDEIFDLYSQLPYGCHFAAIFDCCHSGGIARDGGPRIRGLNAPDDVRHRALRWDSARQMWTARELEVTNRSLAAQPDGEEYLGASGALHRLGRTARLRTLENARYDRLRRELGHRGPYLPILLQACGEGELASEYRHGATAYGAFSFALARQLRMTSRRGISFQQLVRRTASALAALGYDQHPQILGPSPKLRARVPWRVRRRVSAP